MKSYWSLWKSKIQQLQIIQVLKFSVESMHTNEYATEYTKYIYDIASYSCFFFFKMSLKSNCDSEMLKDVPGFCVCVF